MNESRSDYGTFIFYRIKKFDLKKKLELTEGSFWTTFWKYHDQHSIGKPIEITTSRLRFALVSQWNVDHGTSRMLSKNYLPLVLTFFWRRIFWFGKKINDRTASLNRSFLDYFLSIITKSTAIFILFLWSRYLTQMYTGTCGSATCFRIHPTCSNERFLA